MLSIAMTGATSRVTTLPAFGIVRFGFCASNSPLALNEMSKKTTNTIKKSMNGTSGMSAFIDLPPWPVTFFATNSRGTCRSRTLPGLRMGIWIAP